MLKALLLLYTGFQGAVSSGIFTFEITRYEAVGKQRRNDGTGCDGRSTPCEVFFEMCGEVDKTGVCNIIYSEVFQTEATDIDRLPTLVYPFDTESELILNIKLFDLDTTRSTSLNLADSQLLGVAQIVISGETSVTTSSITTTNGFHRFFVTTSGRCDENFYGINCATFCQGADSDALGHYNCDSDGLPVCLQGYEDTTSTIPCSTIVDMCSPNPCINSGSCVQVPGEITFSCICQQGFTGKTCQIDINECDSQPCVNGGTCTQQAPPTFKCACGLAFSGSRCQRTDNVCSLAANVCINEGTCSIVSPGTTACVCKPGYAGARCEIDVNECSTNPCDNGGMCTELSPPNFMCTCQPGSTGSTCDVFVNACTANPCRNGGTCTPGSFTDYTCMCPPGFSGIACEVDSDACVSEPCQNGGKCTDTISGFVCCCAEGFTGNNCEGIREVINLGAFFADFDFFSLFYFRLALSSRCPNLTFITQNEILIGSIADRNCLYGSFFDKARDAGKEAELVAMSKIGHAKLQQIVGRNNERNSTDVTSSLRAELS